MRVIVEIIDYLNRYGHITATQILELQRLGYYPAPDAGDDETTSREPTPVWPEAVWDQVQEELHLSALRAERAVRKVRENVWRHRGNRLGASGRRAA